MRSSKRNPLEPIGWSLMAAGAICLVAGAVGLMLNSAGYDLSWQSMAAAALGIVVAASGAAMCVPAGAPPSAPVPIRAARRTPSPVSVHANAWNEPAPERVKVVAWREDLALPATSSAPSAEPVAHTLRSA